MCSQITIHQRHKRTDKETNRRRNRLFSRLFISLQTYLGERYCISVPPCPDSRWGTA